MALRCDLRLVVAGASVSETQFLVDTGAVYCSMGIDSATASQIPVPPESTEILISAGSADGQSWQRVRPGRIKVWWTQDKQGDPFDWPIYFIIKAFAKRAHGIGIEELDSRPYRNRPPLLGLGGVVTDTRWTVVGPRNSICDDGYVIFEDIRPRS